MMTPEPEAVTRAIERTKVKLDELLENYQDLFSQAYESEEANPVQREVAKASLVSAWNDIYRIISA